MIPKIFQANCSSARLPSRQTIGAPCDDARVLVSVSVPRVSCASLDDAAETAEYSEVTHSGRNVKIGDN